MSQEEIKRKIRKYLETNDNGNTIYQNLWDATKAVLGGMFIVIAANIKKRKSQNQLNFTHQGTGKRTN